MEQFLGDAKSRNNALNLFRVILAIFVLISHSFPLGGFGSEPSIGGLSLGGFAVAGFFSISGFLVTRSRRNLSPIEFARRRILRIYPGYIVAIIVTALVLSLAVDFSVSSWSISSALSYIAWSLPLILGQSSALTATVSGLPYPLGVNGNLWTLAPEAILYVALAVSFSFAFFKRMKWSWIFVIAISSFITILLQNGLLPFHDGMNNKIVMLFFLTNYFFAGVFLSSLRERLKGNWASFIASSLLGLALTNLGFGYSLASIFYAYSILWLSSNISSKAMRLNSVNDYSYGLYLYSFPVQQILSRLEIQNLGLPFFIFASVVATAPLAFLSWRFVEKPALEFSRNFSSKKSIGK